MGILFVMMTGRIKAATAAILTGIVILLDLYNVNKRYLNTDSFTQPGTCRTATICNASGRPSNITRHHSKLSRI